jgi:hypothetical protein
MLGRERRQERHRQAQRVELGAAGREEVPAGLKDRVDLVLPSVGGQQGRAGDVAGGGQRDLLGQRRSL